MSSITAFAAADQRLSESGFIPGETLTLQEDPANPARLNRYMAGARREEPFTIQPGWVAGMPEDQLMRVALEAELTAGWPVAERDDTGALRGNFIGRNWKGILSLPGIGMQPMGTVSPDQEAFNKRPGARQLSFELQSTGKAMFANLLRVILGKGHPTALTMNRYSSSGIPWFSKDVMVKADMVAWLWDPDALKDVLRLLAEGDLPALWEKYRIAFAYAVEHRHQPEDPDKERVIWSGDQWVTASKRIGADPLVPKTAVTDKLGRDRTRNFQAMAWSGNGLLWPFAASLREYMGKFETWYIPGPDSVVDFIRDAAAFAVVDSSNHDQLLPWNVIDMFASAMADVFGPHAYNLVHFAGHAPTVSRYDLYGKPGSVAIGGHANLLDPTSFVGRWVNPSGWNFTDIVAKAGGLFYALYAAHLIGIQGTSEEDIANTLLDRNPHWGFRNMGDNTLARFNSIETRNAWLQAGEQMEYNGFEQTGSFLGMAICRDERGFLHAYPDLVSFVDKATNPGRDYYDPQRGDPRVGRAARQLVYEAHPQFRGVNEVFDNATDHYLGIKLSEDKLAEEEKVSLNFADLMFLGNPDSINYKLDVSAVSSSLIDEFRFTVETGFSYRSLSANGIVR